MQELNSVNDRSTKIIKVAFTVDDEPITPKTAVWTLTDGQGDVINGREQVEFTPLASSMDVVLSNEDHLRTDGRRRYLVIEATYDGLEIDLGLNEQVFWDVNDLMYIV